MKLLLNLYNKILAGYKIDIYKTLICLDLLVFYDLLIIILAKLNFIVYY